MKSVLLVLVCFAPALFALGANLYFRWKYRFVRPKVGAELQAALDSYEQRRRSR